MGEAARKAYMRRTTPSERFDHGIELAESMIQSVIARAGVELDGSPESVKRAFRALRKAGE